MNTPWGEIGDPQDFPDYFVFLICDGMLTSKKMTITFTDSSDATLSETYKKHGRYEGDITYDIKNLSQLRIAVFKFYKEKKVDVSFYVDGDRLSNDFVPSMLPYKQAVVNLTNSGPFVLWTQTEQMDRFQEKLSELSYSEMTSEQTRQKNALRRSFARFYASSTQHFDRGRLNLDYLSGD